MAEALMGLGIIRSQQDDNGRAAGLYEDGLALYRELADTWGIASVVCNLGVVASRQGNYERTAILQQESLALARDLEDTRGIAAALTNLGAVAHLQGDHAVHVEAGLQIAEEQPARAAAHV